jgi:ribosomal protein L7/L12
MFAFLFRHEFTAGDAKRLRRMEQKIDLILKHLQIDFVEPGAGDGLREEVRALADGGNKIAAIKKHRELTGDGLVEAKRAVEAYMSPKS